MDDENPECDFCEMKIEDDETLEPLYVGELPQPKPHYLRATAMRGGMRDNRYKGKYDALRMALHECPDIDLNESNVVHEVQAVGGETHSVSENSMVYGDTPDVTEFETNRNRDKVGVELKIRPKNVTYSPDAEVCSNCVEMFRNL